MSLTTPSSAWSRPLKFEGWAALLPVIVFLGGLSMASGLSDLSDFAASRTLPQGLSSAPFLARPNPTGSLKTDSPSEGSSRVVADFAPLSALMLPAGQLATHHQEVFVEMVRALNGELPVIALVANEVEEKRCEELLSQNKIENKSLHFLHYALDSMWLRDFGPIFIRREDGEYEIVDVSYSGGASNERWRDDECPILISRALQLPLRSAPLRLQGGNLLSNNCGLLLTSNSVNSENRSRGFSPADLREGLHTHFGADQWLALEPLRGELTQHADTFVSFLSPGLVLVAEADRASDPNNASLLDAAAESLASLETRGGLMEVHRLPLPAPGAHNTIRSYNNFVIANDLVLVPSFSDVPVDLEKQAHDTLRRLLPDKRVVPINCDSMLQEGGLLRCMTLGIPEGVPWKRLYQRTVAVE